jgi:hypothetical protein
VTARSCDLRAPERDHNLMLMTNRIALSALLLLSLLFTGCASRDVPLDDEPELADGIGTSPSADDDQGEGGVIIMKHDECVIPVYPCGVWVDVNASAADIRALACEPADVVVYSGSRVQCSDAATIATEHPAWRDRSFVRRLDARGRALEGHCD